MLTPKTLFLGALAATLALLPALLAADTSSPWSLKLRATYLATVDESSGALGKDVLSVDDKLIPEFDIGYRLIPSWSLELVATIPQEQTVNLEGVGEIGTFQHLPPTLLLQYRPQVSEVFQPYVGAGVNYTFIFDDDLLGGAAKLENGSVGPAAQLGFDVKIADRWSVNMDVKRILIRSDVTVAGQTVAEARLDPWLYSVGLVYAF